MQTPRMVIFDMDGTLTVPRLDFDGMRAEIGLPPGTLLEQIGRLDAPGQARAFEIIERHEALAAAQSELHDRAADLLDYLQRRGIAVGIFTRNSRRSADTVLARHGLRVDCLYTREDGPVKPAPDAVFALCEHCGVPPAETWVVGDYLYDVQSGKRAGCRTFLMLGRRATCDYIDEADHVIRDLWELVPLIEGRGA